MRKLAFLTFALFLVLTLVAEPLNTLFPFPNIPEVKAISSNLLMQEWFDYEYIMNSSQPAGQGIQYAKFREVSINNDTGRWHDFGITANNPINGTHSAYRYVNGSAMGDRHFAWQSSFNVYDPYPDTYPTWSNPVYLRTWVRLDTWTATGTLRVGILSIQERSGFEDLSQIMVEGQNANLTLFHKNSTGSYWIDSNSNLTVGQIHCLEIGREHNNETDGWARVWLDGVEVSDLTQSSQNTTVPTAEVMDGYVLGHYGNAVGETGAECNMTLDGFKVGRTYIGNVDAALTNYVLSIRLLNSTDSSMMNGSVRLGMDNLGDTDDDWINTTIPEGTLPKVGVPNSIDGAPFWKFQLNGTNDYNETYPTSWGMTCSVQRNRGGDPFAYFPPIYGNTTFEALYNVGEEPPPPSNYAIDDGFEYDGDYSYMWNGTYANTDEEQCNITYSSAAYHHGVNSSLSEVGDNTNASYAFAYRDFSVGGAHNEFWLRAYVRYTLLQISDSHFAIALYHTGGLPVTNFLNLFATAGVYNNSGTPYWIFRYQNATTNYVETGAWSSFQLNTWYCFEIHFNVSDTDGAAEFWINENLNASHYGMDTNWSSQKIRYALVGGWCNAWNRPTTLYVDCVRGNSTLSTSYIGMEEEPDSTPPTYSNVGTDGVTDAGEEVEIQCYWNDDVELDYYQYETNNTGTLANSSTYEFYSTPSWSNESFFLNSTVGVAVAWRFHAWDNSSNYNYTSPLQHITTTDGDLPTFSSIGSNETQAGLPCLLRSYWNDNVALSTYAVEHNNTGTLQNITNTFGGTPAWANETVTLNSTVGVVVAWRSHGNDTADNWNVTAWQYITTTSAGDVTAPTYSNAAHNTTIAGNPVLFSCRWTDESGLSGYVFGTNNSGSWVNDTWASLGSNPAWANETRTLNSTIGVRVEYRWWCNDTADNWNNTGILYLTTSSSDAPPTYSQISYNTTTRTYVVQFSVFLEDDTGLSICFFRWNGTGAWGANETISVGGASSWANITKTLPSSAGVLVGFRWYFNDTVDQWNGTGIQTLVTTEIWFYFSWDVDDLDANDVKSRITWVLYNDTDPLSYTEGASTLLNDTYTLHVSFAGEEINQTTLETWVSGNSTVTIELQMKKLLALNRWVAFNETVGSITVHDATDDLTNFTVTGSGTFYMICQVPRNCSHIEKAGVNQTGWIYETSTVKFNTTLSQWELYHAAAAAEATQMTLAMRQIYAGLAIVAVAGSVAIGGALVVILRSGSAHAGMALVLVAIMIVLLSAVTVLMLSIIQGL